MGGKTARRKLSESGAAVNIGIYYEAGEIAGQGHKERMTHLAETLDARGHLVWMSEKPSNERMMPPTELLIVDVPINDDGFLELLKRVGIMASINTKVVVFVGVGKSITAKTAWIADLIIYQAAHRKAPNLPYEPFGYKIIGGPKYIM